MKEEQIENIYSLLQSYESVQNYRENSYGRRGRISRQKRPYTRFRATDKMIHFRDDGPDDEDHKQIYERNSSSYNRPADIEYFPEYKQNYSGLQNYSEPSYPMQNPKPLQYLNTEPKKQNEAIIDPSFSGISIVKSLEILSADASILINKCKGGYEEIIAINELLAEIKVHIKKDSPSSSLRLIGSSHIGSYIKDSDIDIIFIDYLNPDPGTLLSSSILYLKLGECQLSDQSLIFRPNNFRFKFNFIINEEIAYESSCLLKKYCKLDNRCADLIILVKI